LPHKGKAGSSFPSFVEGDVGGKGRRCATAPLTPTLVLTHWHSLTPHPFMATKSWKVHVDLRTVYVKCIRLYGPVYISIYTLYIYTLSTSIYRGEREREREREREQTTFPTSSNHRHSTAQPTDKKKKQALDVVSFRLLKVKYENYCRENVRFSSDVIPPRVSLQLRRDCQCGTHNVSR